MKNIIKRATWTITNDGTIVNAFAHGETVNNYSAIDADTMAGRIAKGIKKIKAITGTAYFQFADDFSDDTAKSVVKSQFAKDFVIPSDWHLTAAKLKNNDGKAIFELMKKIAADYDYNTPLKGIFFDTEAKKAVATDAHRLVASRLVFDMFPEFHGKIIDFKKGVEITGKYPMWQNAKPSDSDQYLTILQPIVLDFVSGSACCGSIDGAPMSFNYKWFRELCKFAPAAWKGSTPYRGIMAADDDLMLLLMPTINSDNTELPAVFDAWTNEQTETSEQEQATETETTTDEAQQDTTTEEQTTDTEKSFVIGQRIILGADVFGERKHAVKGTIKGCCFSEKIKAYIYEITGDDGQQYASTSADIIADKTTDKSDNPDENFLDKLFESRGDKFKKMVFAIVEGMTNDKADYYSKNEISVSFGWDGCALSPVSRVAFVKKYGKTLTEEAEADAKKIIEADREQNRKSQYNRHAQEATNRNFDEIPETGFYYTIHSGLKNEGGGLQQEITDICDTLADENDRKPAPQLTRVIDVIFVSPDEFNNPATPDNLVRQYVESGIEFAGGARTDDPAPILGDDYRYYYTEAAAVVCPELGKWYAIDAEGYEYARYILLPCNWREMYAENVAEWENEQKRQEKEKQRAIEAEQAAEVAEVEKWRGILETPPEITAKWTEGAILGKQKNAYQNALKRNIAKVIKHYYPNICGLKIKICSEYYHEEMGIYWTDGATVAEVENIKEIYNFVSAVYVADPYSDYGDHEHRAEKKLWRDTFGGTLHNLTRSDVRFYRTLSDTAQAEADQMTKNYLPSYDPEKKQWNDNTEATFGQFHKFFEALGIADNMALYNIGNRISRDDETGVEVWSFANQSIKYYLQKYYTPQEPEPTPEPTPDTPQGGDGCKFDGCEIVRYSDKAVAVIGNTRPYAALLKAAGGRFNARLTCGAGWIFPASRRAQLTA